MRHWTQEERQKQSKLIQKWKPWNQSTGPKTEEGKSTAKLNAYKHGGREAQIRELAQNFTDLKRKLSQLINAY